MCLGIPGQLVELAADNDQLARVEVTGVRRMINIGLLEDEVLEPGDWVLIHVGLRDVEDRRGRGGGRPGVAEAHGLRARRRDGDAPGDGAVKFVDEYRDPVASRRVLSTIRELAGTDRHYKFMEVCGGHTHTIYRHGIEHVLPQNVELVHGPGCPVCVIPMGRIDDAIAVAETPGVIFTSFGDMMRVPGGNGTLLEAKARGADVRFVYSPLDALKVAVDNPDREVVFFAVGLRDHRALDRRHAGEGARRPRS